MKVVLAKTYFGFSFLLNIAVLLITAFYLIVERMALFGQPLFNLIFTTTGTVMYAWMLRTISRSRLHALPPSTAARYRWTSHFYEALHVFGGWWLLHEVNAATGGTMGQLPIKVNLMYVCLNLVVFCTTKGLVAIEPKFGDKSE